MSNKFIGMGPNQVPTNSDLGTMAYVDHKGVGDLRFGHLTYEPRDQNRFSLSDASPPARIAIKQHVNTESEGIYIERYNERKGYYIFMQTSSGAGSGGGQDGLIFRRNNNGTKDDTMMLDRDGNIQTGRDINVGGAVIQREEVGGHVIVSDTWSVGPLSVGRFAIDLNSRVGASTATNGFWRVTIGGYATAGANSCNMTYTVGGYTGHSYSVYNHNSIGAGTIQNGYQSSNSTNYQTLGHSYHPCINHSAYIYNGQIWVYVPSSQQYGFSIVNDSSYAIGGTITVEHAWA